MEVILFTAVVAVNVKGRAAASLRDSSLLAAVQAQLHIDNESSSRNELHSYTVTYQYLDI